MGAGVLIRALAVLILCFSATCAVTASEERSSVRQAVANTPEKAGDSTASNRPIADKWALVIGISRFKDPSIQLKYAAKDARDFYDYLINQANFAKDHVRLLIDEGATRENILNQLGDKWLPRVAMPDDLVVMYISSHGSPSNADIGGLNYLVAHNTDKDSLYASGIPVQDLTRLIKDRVHAERVVVVLDACHSGAVRTDNKGLFRQANFNADEIAQGAGQLVICSSEPNQSSWESKNYPNGVFTRQFIDALRQKDGRAPLGEAFQTTRDRVSQEVLRDRGELQRPVLKSAWEGQDLVLSAVPSTPRPGLEDVSATINAGTEQLTTATDRPGGSASIASAEKPRAPGVALAADNPRARLLDSIAPIWTVKEHAFGIRYTSKWRFDRAKEEFDAVHDNGTQAIIQIVEYDGHHIVMTSRNYAGKHKGHMYRYEGTCTTHGASGKAHWSNSPLAPMTWKWEASW